MEIETKQEIYEHLNFMPSSSAQYTENNRIIFSMISVSLSRYKMNSERNASLALITVLTNATLNHHVLLAKHKRISEENMCNVDRLNTLARPPKTQHKQFTQLYIGTHTRTHAAEQIKWRRATTTKRIVFNFSATKYDKRVQHQTVKNTIEHQINAHVDSNQRDCKLVQPNER